ncbi:MAG: UDP-N-acetylmuramate dehydrogenase [Candidatus Zixiibacteriota bacterium]
MTEQVRVSPNIPRSAVKEAFGDMVEFDRPLAPLSTYRTGGSAKYFICAKTADLLSGTVKAARRLKMPYFVIGGGSNILVSDRGYDGLIVKVDIRGLGLVEVSTVNCGAGEDLKSLVDFATEKSLTGMEFAAGIWGTVGGAIYGNAGAYGGEMKDVVSEVEYVDTAGDLRKAGADHCRFGYRDSYFKRSGEIIASAVIRLKEGTKTAIEGKVKEILRDRMTKHPAVEKTAGCFFKNVLDSREKYGKLPAGKLLDEIGAKQMRVGGAVVFEKHANMIVNTGNATSKDIRQLADILKKKVYDRFGITLEEEVIQIGEF